jgi:hypothetical protein
MTARGLSLLFALWCMALPALAQEVHPAELIIRDGAGPLRLAGQARRADLLGSLELYAIALYADGAPDRERLASPDTAKALRIVVSYRNDLRRPVTLDWQRELIPRLEARAVAQLRSDFAALRQGDVVQIEYAPARGTTVRINRGVAVPDAHHDLMLAFLDHWLGDRPVSEELKRALLGPSARGAAAPRGPTN